MKVDLQGKIVVIWGACSVIGRETAGRFSDNGAVLALCDADNKKPEEVAEEIRQAGGRATSFGIVCNEKESVINAIKEIHDRLGGPDILINIPTGLAEPDDSSILPDISPAQWKKSVDDELRMVYLFSKAVTPYMSQKESGCIINVVSAAGMVALRGQSAVSAAHAGVISFSKAIALELAHKSIRVNSVVYGFISGQDEQYGFYGNRSEDLILQFIPQKRAGKPADVAAAVLCLADGDMGYVTGCEFTVDGGWSCGYARDF